MSKFIVLVVIGFIAASHVESTPMSASDLVGDMYSSCLQYFSVNCVKPKVLAWISNVYDDSVIHITDDLSVRKTDELTPYEKQQRYNDASELAIVDRFEDFLTTHAIDIKVPAALRPGGFFGKFVPRALVPEDVSVPLTSEGRHRKKSGLMKKVIIPFLLGLKFKTGIVVPLLLALIALKTWKALTLSLLSLVLSGALVIFKFTKPKIVNYEVIHYPHHVDHHVDHIEHAAPAPAWDHPGYGRAMDQVEDAQNLAYNAYTS